MLFAYGRATASASNRDRDCSTCFEISRFEKSESTRGRCLLFPPWADYDRPDNRGQAMSVRRVAHVVIVSVCVIVDTSWRRPRGHQFDRMAMRRV